MSDQKAALWDARYVQEGYETQSLTAYTDVVRELILQSKEILHSLDIRDGRLLDVAGGGENQSCRSVNSKLHRSKNG